MSQHLINEELQAMPVSTPSDNLLHWMKEHRDYVAGAIITVIVIVLLGAYVAHRLNTADDAAWDKLFGINQLAYSGRVDEAVKGVGELEQAFPRSNAAGYGILFEGDVMFAQKKYKEAEEAYKKLLARKRPEKLMPMALLGVAKTQQAEGNFQDAANSAKDFIARYSDSMLSAEAHMTLASALEQAGKAEEAKTAYDKVVLLFPNSYWASAAKAKLPAPQKVEPKK